MGPCSPTLVSPTLDQKVVFHLLLKILYLVSKQHAKFGNEFGPCQSDILYHDWLCLYHDLELRMQVNDVLVPSNNVKS